MTTLSVVPDCDRAENGVVGSDPDADVGFFSMSPASAEQVTVQIRNVLDRAWEFIALAYKGRAFLALGYASWDEYVDARFGDLRIAVPREHRTQVVASLAGARMSVRAIARLLGVGVATVHREMVRSTGVQKGHAETPENPPPTLGRDGKTYPRGPRLQVACSLCGEFHADTAGGCPWDRFAQGLGPLPGSRQDAGITGRDAQDDTGLLAEPAVSKGQQRKPNLVDPGGLRPAEEATAHADAEASAGGLASVDELLNRVDALLDEISGFAGLIATIEAAARLEPSPEDDVAAVARRIRALVEDVRSEIASWPAFIARLQRVAEVLGPC